MQSIYPIKTSSFEQFMASVKVIPVLSETEEQTLIDRYINNQCEESARSLITHNLRFVAYIAHSYKGYGLPTEDLVQEGVIGLMTAIKNFSPAEGVRLISFAVYHIKKKMVDYVISNWKIIKIATTKAQRKLFFKKTLFSDMTDEQIATDLNLSASEVSTMRQRMFSTDLSYQLESSTTDEDDNMNLVLESPDTGTEGIVLESEQITEMKNALVNLNDRERDIIESRYLADEPLILEDLSKKYSVSKERIRQIEVNALKKLSNQLQGIR